MFLEENLFYLDVKVIHLKEEGKHADNKVEKCLDTKCKIPGEKM